MDQYKKLVWKHFFKQKWEEIQGLLLSCWVVLSISAISFQMRWVPESGGPIILAKIGLVILIIDLIVLVYYSIKGFYNWIKSNWKLAKENATKEYNNLNKMEEIK